MKGFLSVTGFREQAPVAGRKGVVKVNAINQKVLVGQPVCAAVVNGALSRLRPMLTTAAIAALGLSGARPATAANC
ncbi:MAG: hypothetical protein KDG55_05495 [Rhodocyclaceae bacterium]|nr:hypothetical protein [Rhodocyclaceae bacterium]